MLNEEVTTPTAEQIAEAKALLAKAQDSDTPAVSTDEVATSTDQSEVKPDSVVNLDVPIPSPQYVTISPEQFAHFQKAVREGVVARKVKDMGNEYTSRRNTLILRKVAARYPDLVNDEEVVAYYDIYKMREAVSGDSKKTVVSDKEVAAYLELWTGEITPSLEAIENLIAKKSLG